MAGLEGIRDHARTIFEGEIVCSPLIRPIDLHANTLARITKANTYPKP